jgi:Rrf2 family transcriptional regulator, iron-sulfur cluster assembly transcription factor
MKATAKTKFAISAMLCIARQKNQHNKPITTLLYISEQHNISIPYLESIFVRLRKSNLVESHRGPSGGYSIAHELSSISILDIILAVESDNDDEDVSNIKKNKNLNENDEDIISTLASLMQNRVHAYCAKVSLKDLLSNFSKTTTKSDLNTEKNEKAKSIPRWMKMEEIAPSKYKDRRAKYNKPPDDNALAINSIFNIGFGINSVAAVKKPKK